MTTRTEADLRTVIAADADDVTDARSMIAEITATHRAAPAMSRRWVVGVAAAASVTAAVGVPAIVLRRHPAGRTAGRPALAGPELAFTFDVGAVPGYRITPDAIHPTFQGAAISAADGHDLFGEVTVTAVGAFDPSSIRRGEPVDVNGNRGYFGRATMVDYVAVASSDGAPPAPAPKVQMLAWEYAPDRWAQVYLPGTGSAVRSASATIARAVRTGVRQPLRLPMRIGQLPAALRWRISGYTGTESAGDWHTGLEFGRTAADEHWLLVASVWKGGIKPAFKPTSTVDGRPAAFTAGHPIPVTPAGPKVVHRIDPGKSRKAVQVDPGPVVNQLVVDLGQRHWFRVSGNYTEAQLREVAATTTIASNLEDRSTWFDAS